MESEEIYDINAVGSWLKLQDIALQVIIEKRFNLSLSSDQFKFLTDELYTFKKYLFALQKKVSESCDEERDESEELDQASLNEGLGGLYISQGNEQDSNSQQSYDFNEDEYDGEDGSEVEEGYEGEEEESEESS